MSNNDEDNDANLYDEEEEEDFSRGSSTSSVRNDEAMFRQLLFAALRRGGGGAAGPARRLNSGQEEEEDEEETADDPSINFNHLFRRFNQSRANRATSNDSNLVTGAAFDASRKKKRELLLGSDRGREIFSPVAASSNFLLRPRPQHAVTAQQLRVAEEKNSTAAFWEAYEDEVDDAQLLLAKKRNNSKIVSSSSSIAKTPPRAVAAAFATESNNNNDDDDDDGGGQQKNDEKKANSETPRRADEMYSAEEYSPWAGPSPVAKNTYNSSNEATVAAAASATSSSSAASRPVSRTVASSSASSAPACEKFLSSAPNLLPSTSRGIVQQGHAFQPISGVAVARLPSSASASSDTIHMVVGSRSGTLATSTISVGQWKKMLSSSSSSDNSNRYADPLSEDREDDRGAMVRRPTSLAAVAAEAADANSFFEITSSAKRSSNLSLEMEDVTVVRRGAAMLLSTSWHPTRRMYCAAGGAPEVVVGYCPEDAEEEQEQEEDDTTTPPLQDGDAAPPRRLPTRIGNILPYNATTQRRARNLVVDIAPGRNMRSYVFDVDWFSDTQIVCGCSGGGVATLQIRPDGRFSCQQHAIHGEDVNAVSRFGADADAGGGSLFVSGGDDKKVALFDERVEGGSVAYGTGCSNGVMGIANRGDGVFFASTSKDQIIRLWDSRNLRSPVTLAGARRGSMLDNDDSHYRWNHYNDPESAPLPAHARDDMSAVLAPNAARFCYTLARCAFSPMATTGGRYLLTGGVCGGQVVDIVKGTVVALLSWDESQTTDEMVRDVAWLDASTVLICTQTTMHVFSV